MKVLVIDDSPFKTADIIRALKDAGVGCVESVREQATAWSKICDAIEQNKSYDLIVTDMHYPLEKGVEADWQAGFKLIAKMKEGEINIPLVICSSHNFQCEDIFGTPKY